MKMRKIGMLGLALVAVAGLAACNKKDTPADPGQQQGGDKDPAGPTYTISEYRAYALADLAFDFENVENEKDNLADGVYTKAKAAYDNGRTAINNATTVTTIKKAYETASKAILAEIPAANGVFDYTGLSLEERKNLTAVVEKYAVATGLTGLTLYEEGGYQLINPRVTLGTENYILSYGFGTLAEGSITGDLDTETNENWKQYYHSYESSDPQTANYWNDKGAQVGDIYGYFNASLFTTFMNDTKDSYKWVGELSKDDRPQPVSELDEKGQTNTWRVKIKTGADGLKYNTLSSINNRAAFNNREVVAEDYLTPYKIQLTQHNHLFRGGEYAGGKGNKIAGLSAYYQATENTTGLWDENLWNQKVGDNLKVYQENGEWYFQWTNTQPTNAFYAMYQIAGSMYSPVPFDFINTVGLESYLGFNSDKTTSPVDNSLSLGSYTLESWETDKAIVLKKNPNYVYATSKYSIKGVHLAILSGISTDEDLAIREFLANKLDACRITQNYLDKYKNDPRSHFYGAGSNFKLNLNTANAATWEYYFGENGVVNQNAKADYYAVDPAMSNTHFIRGLSYALNRKSIADAHAAVPSFSFLGGQYMSDPENGEFYNSTDAHKDAISFFTEDTDGYGYSLELARDYFKWALKELEEEGSYTRGTKDNPTVINLEIAWMEANQEKTYHAEVKECLEAAFNDESVSGGCYKLNVSFWAGEVWSDVYYKKLMTGYFDLGFGSISGNTYDILDYLLVLSADQDLSGGFTLNWGPKTDDPDQYFLIYDGVKWSFDAILSAANQPTLVKDGVIANSYELVGNKNYTANADGTVTLTATLSTYEGIDVEVADVVAFGYVGGEQDSDKYTEQSVLNAEGTNLVVTANADGTKTVTVTVSAELFAYYTQTAYYIENGIACDFYLVVTGEVDGVDFGDPNALVTLKFTAAA